MMKALRRRPSPGLVVASLALAIALGGTGYAAVVLPANSVGTKQLKNGAVVASKVKPHSLVASNFAKPPKGDKGDKGDPGSQGTQGLPGQAGAKGDKGDKGDPATKLFAAVAKDGTAIVKSAGVNSAHGSGSGKYVVTFPQGVSNCAPIVSIADTDGGEAAAAVPAAGSNTLNVSTFSLGGGTADRAFSVAVFC
jgi:hypothetical protein